MKELEEMLQRAKDNLDEWRALNDWDSVIFCAKRIESIQKMIQEVGKYEYARSNNFFKAA